MKKLFFFAATAAIALSSCSSDDALTATPDGTGVNDGAVSFEAYSARQTRAAVTDLAAVKNNGFGVFAYDQGAALFTNYSATNTQPNFMYNQLVDWDNTNNVWKYSPIKFFNNNVDAKHSFFAYAPYDASVNAIFTNNKAPQIRYNVATDDVDLLWGCEWNTNGAAATTAPIDKEKPSVSTKIGFNFKHALSQLTILAAPFIDDVHGPSTNPTLHEEHGINSVLAYRNKVALRSVKLIGTNLPTKGLLNLQNGNWTIEETDENVYDFATDIMWDATVPGCASSGLTIDHRETVQDKMMVIPTENRFKIQVVYDVITEDPDEPKNATTITNTITSEEDFPLEQGVAYEYHLDLGLTSVKFDAKVIGWDVDNDIDVDLPNNMIEDLTDLTSLGALPTQIITDWKGKAEKDPFVGAVDDYYYNTKDEKLMKCTVANVPATNTPATWVAAPDNKYFYNSEIYTVTGGSGACTIADAPIWWYNSTGDSYYRLENGTYGTPWNTAKVYDGTTYAGDAVKEKAFWAALNDNPSSMSGKVFKVWSSKASANKVYYVK